MEYLVIELNGEQIKVTDKCVGCGICVRVCPIANFYVENGKAKSKLLEYGKYYVKEKSTGSDYYLLNTEKYYVEITENGKTIPVTIENTSIKVEKELPKTGF